MLERKISDDLLEWKRSGTGKALLLTGARQIGKSYAVREFAKHEYAHYLEINLYENKQAARALASANDGQEFIDYARQVYHQYETLAEKYAHSR